MHDILRTIEFLCQHIWKNEIVSMELLPFCNKMTRTKVILVTWVTAKNGRKMSACCNYAKFGEIMHDMLRTIEFLGHHILKNGIVSI